ncbi:MAG: hypothetical protein M4579_004713 [Chaenotheca gracillima]|nr:MAG: hypothetical protein M4579_004713 [Chaenotheca gracillima]
MPRQRGGGRAPSRPTAAPSRPNAAPPQPQRRQASSAAYPPAKQQAQPPAKPQQQGQAPGLFGQMASTAAGVAVGSSIGHAIGGFFGGGSAAPAEQQEANMTSADQQQSNAYSNDSWGSANCEVDARQFTKCLDDNGGNMQICSWYLEQLKACQSAARQY